MRVYLVRHGIAVEAGERDIQRDAERVLSEEGRARTRDVARGLKRLGVDVDRIFSSPLARAVQTAEILASLVGGERDVEPIEALRPGGDPEKVVRELAGCGESTVMLVGHMPDLSVLASTLVARHAESAFQFKKASVLVLAFDGPVKAGAAIVEAFLPPGVVRRIRKTL